jgi:hypothetical protein
MDEKFLNPAERMGRVGVHHTMSVVAAPRPKGRNHGGRLV